MKRIIITESQFLRLKNHIDKLLITESFIGLSNLSKWVGGDLPNFKKIASETDIPVNKAFNDRMATPQFSKAGNLNYPLKNGEFFWVNNKKNQEFTKMLDDALESGDFTNVNKRIDDFKSDKTIKDVLKAGPKNTSYNKVAGYIDDLEDRAAETKKNHDNLKQPSKVSSPNPTKTSALPSFTKEELKQNLDRDLEMAFNEKVKEYDDEEVLIELKDAMFLRFKGGPIYDKLLNTNAPLSDVINEMNNEIDKLASSRSLEKLKPEDKDRVKAFLNFMKNNVVSHQKEQLFWSKKYKIVNGKKIISLPKTGFNILVIIIGILGLTEGVNRLAGGDFKPMSWMINNLMKSFGMDNTKESLLDLLKDEASSINVGDKSVSIYGKDAPENLYLKDLDENGLTYSSKDKILTINSGIQLGGVLFKSFIWDGAKKELSVNLPFENSLDGFKLWFITPESKGGFGQSLQSNDIPSGVKDNFTIKYSDGDINDFKFENGTFK